MFNKSYSLYSLFWALNMKIIDVGEVKKIDDMRLSIMIKTKPGFRKIKRI